MESTPDRERFDGGGGREWLVAGSWKREAGGKEETRRRKRLVAASNEMRRESVSPYCALIYRLIISRIADFLFPFFLSTKYQNKIKARDEHQQI